MGKNIDCIEESIAFELKGVCLGGNQLQNTDHVLARVIAVEKHRPPAAYGSMAKITAPPDETIHLTTQRCNYGLPILWWKM